MVIREKTDYTKKVNGYRLTPILTLDACKLPDGTELIYAKYTRDFKTYKVTDRKYYRCILERKPTVGGPMEAVRMSPNADWPEIPPWQGGWIWLRQTDGFSEFFTAEPLEEWEVPGWN